MRADELALGSEIVSFEGEPIGTVAATSEYTSFIATVEGWQRISSLSGKEVVIDLTLRLLQLLLET